MLYPATPNVDVFLIQEAQNTPGGDIWRYLNGLAGFTAHHINEQPGGGGAGYICATRNASATVVVPLTLYNYHADPNFANIGLPNHTIANVLNRPPAYTVLTVGGRTIFLITWHAPRGVSLLPIIVGAMAGGALIDAYVALENSQLISNPSTVAGMGVDIVIIAGDLNATAAALGATYPPPPLPGRYQPLNNFDGYSNKLDHILAWRLVGGPPNIDQGRQTRSLSVHDIISAQIDW